MGKIIKKSNFDFIDVCKAWGIVLVVLGHTTLFPNTMPMSYVWLYSFHMPFFFMIFGYTYNNNKYKDMKFKELFVKRFKSYIIPYWSFAIINFVLLILFNVFVKNIEITTKFITDNVWGLLYCYPNIEYMANCTPIWFLSCLFMASIIFWFVMKFSIKVAGLISCGCAMVSYLLYIFVDFILPWSITSSLMAVLFIYVGYIIRQYSIIEKVVTKGYIFAISFVVTLVVGSVCGLVNAKIYDILPGMGANNYGNLFLFVISGVFISLSFFILFYKLKFLHIRPFTWLGRNTIYIVGFNYIARDIAIELYYITPILRNCPIKWYSLFIYTMVVLIVGISLYNFSKNFILNMLKHKTNSNPKV